MFARYNMTVRLGAEPFLSLLVARRRSFVQRYALCMWGQVALCLSYTLHGTSRLYRGHILRGLGFIFVAVLDDVLLVTCCTVWEKEIRWSGFGLMLRRTWRLTPCHCRNFDRTREDQSMTSEMPCPHLRMVKLKYRKHEGRGKRSM